MAQPDLVVLAEGDLPAGQHWILKHRDEGGMGGPPLYPGSLMNTFTGGSDRGLRRVVVRADPGVLFFATLLPRAEGLVSVTAVGADGQMLEPQNLV